MRTFKSAPIAVVLTDAELDELICNIDENLIRLESSATALLRRPTARIQRYDGEDQFYITAEKLHIQFTLDVPNKTVHFVYEGTLYSTHYLYEWFGANAEDLIKVDPSYKLTLLDAKAEYTIKTDSE